jgi:hypothetical protein
MFTLQLQTIFKPLSIKEGGVNPLVEITVNGKDENVQTFVPVTSKNSDSGIDQGRHAAHAEKTG